MGEKTALTCLVTFIPLLIASLGFPSFASTPTAFIHHPPPTTISSNLLHPSSSLSVVYQTTQSNLHPSSFLQLPSSPSRISTASFISISCDQRRLVFLVFLSLLCFLLLFLFHSLDFILAELLALFFHQYASSHYGESIRHNAIEGPIGSTICLLT